MKGVSGSRYILGHIGTGYLVQLDVGEEAVLVLNPEFPNARSEASKSIKSAFHKSKKRCVLRSQRILVEQGDGNWQQSWFLTVKVVALDHLEADSI